MKREIYLARIEGARKVQEHLTRRLGGRAEVAATIASGARAGAEGARMHGVADGLQRAHRAVRDLLVDSVPGLDCEHTNTTLRPGDGSPREGGDVVVECWTCGAVLCRFNCGDLAEDGGTCRRCRGT